MLAPLYASAAVALLGLASTARAAIMPSSSVDGRPLEARSAKTCRGVGEYPIPQAGKCKPCSWKFTGASRCTTTAATKCATGYLSNGSCVKACPVSQFNNAGTCTACTKKFAGALTCTASGATKCATGYLLNGKCLATCLAGYINNPGSKKCAACSSVPSALTCSAGKVATCAAGHYVNPTKTGCASCTAVDPNAATCSSATAITSCHAPFTLAANKRRCQLANNWSLYLSSSIPDIPYNSIRLSTVTCGRNAVANAQPLSVYDPDTASCYESAGVNATLVSTLVWDDNASVFVYGTCAVNNKAVPSDAKSRCYDALITATACTLTASGQACTVLGNDCNGDQFRNVNGLCQDCQSVYDDALTCDIYNGATSCIDGDYVNDGQCASCTDFDPQAATCAAGSAPISSCNYGFAPARDGLSCVVESNATTPDAQGNEWAYYMNAFLPDVSAWTVVASGDDVSDQFDCAEQVWATNTVGMSAYNATSGVCYSHAKDDTDMANIAETDDGSAVIVLGTCADNEAFVTADTESLCNDVNLTGDSCMFGYDDETPCA